MSNQSHKRRHEEITISDSDEDTTDDSDDSDEFFSLPCALRSTPPKGGLARERRAYDVISYYKQRAIHCINRRDRKRRIMQRDDKIANNLKMVKYNPQYDCLHHNSPVKNNLTNMNIAPQLPLATYTDKINRQASTYCQTVVARRGNDRFWKQNVANNLDERHMNTPSLITGNVNNAFTQRVCTASVTPVSSFSKVYASTSKHVSHMSSAADAILDRAVVRCTDKEEDDANPLMLKRQIAKSSSIMLLDQSGEKSVINKAAFNKENNINGGNVENQIACTSSGDQRICKYFPVAKLKDQAFDIPENNYNRYFRKQLTYRGRNNSFYGTFKDYICRWHIARGFTHIDENILGMIKEIDSICNYLDRLYERADELNVLVRNKKQICLKILQLRDETGLCHHNIPGKKEREKRDDPLVNMFLHRCQMSKEDLDQEKDKANEMHDFLAAHEILLPRRENDYNEASNDVMRNSITARKPIETFHYIIKPNGDLSLVENKCQFDKTEGQVAIQRLEILETIIKNFRKMNCNHIQGDRKAVDCIHCLYSWYRILNEQVERWQN